MIKSEVSVNKSFPAKILLFGEYGILLGSMALAIPYPLFSGKFGFPDLPGSLTRSQAASNQSLKKLLLFLKSKADDFQFINLELLKDEIVHGLFFDSTIPVGAGLGSSGSLTAALYTRYLNRKDADADYNIIKSRLASIEDYFHGTSSGFDALTSLLEKPVLLEPTATRITSPDLSPFLRKITVYLIGMNSTGATGSLVKYFMDHYSDKGFKEIIENQYKPLINNTIVAAMDTGLSDLGQFLGAYSEFQLTFFREMIPAQMRNHFGYGIRTGKFYLKLCGSGGGYILGFATDRAEAESYFNLNLLNWIVVNPGLLHLCSSGSQ